jgi:hypothetical protein
VFTGRLPSDIFILVFDEKVLNHVFKKDSQHHGLLQRKWHLDLHPLPQCDAVPVAAVLEGEYVHLDSKTTLRQRWQFAKPFFNYIDRNSALRGGAVSDRRLKKLRYLKGSCVDRTASPRRKAEHRLRKMRRAVLLFLRKHDNGLFLGRAWCPVRKQGIEKDFYPEIRYSNKT